MSEVRRRLAQMMQDSIPIDIGTTSLTAFARAALPSRTASVISHPIFETLPLSAADVTCAGSNFQRVGFVWPHANDRAKDIIDSYGVRWLETDGSLAPYSHPLESAEWESLNSHPRPKLPTQIQFPDTKSDAPTILDSPCSGLLDTCFMLRSGWQFMMDLTENFRIANALLDWSLETISDAYIAALEALPKQPDIVVYADDLGFQSGMYLSDLDFRTFIFPRLQVLFARIHKQTGSLICFHSCGAISSIVDDIVALDVDMLNLDFYAKNVLFKDIRRKIPSDMILHTPVNVVALGQSIASGNRASLALLTVDIAASTPCIGGPIDILSTWSESVDAIRGSAFIRSLSNDDIKQINQFGPVKSIIEKASKEACDFDVPVFPGGDIPFGELSISD